MEVSAIGGRVHSYLHTTDHSVPETIALTRHAEAVGAEAVMIWPPYEWAKSQEMICDFYEYVASQVDIAIFVYNTYHSGVAMTPETISRLARIPNVCALKDAVNDFEHTLRCMGVHRSRHRGQQPARGASSQDGGPARAATAAGHHLGLPDAGPRLPADPRLL